MNRGMGKECKQILHILKIRIVAMCWNIPSIQVLRGS